MKKHNVNLNVNGREVMMQVEPRQSLGDALRGELGLTGTHLGCEHGVCGACTIIVNGDPVRSCLMLAVQAEGAEVVTIEGASPAIGLSEIQEALREFHGLQCGFCTPGMVMALHHLFSGNPQPSEPEIREAISGQLCRCTGYQGIMNAAKAVAARHRLKNVQK
ncbi:(2Fe-2S)-binding protein [Ciceribacter azotifigens]|uniref:(2Fe-2S)-binding protein n=1 Tax=Ciceribacter azotifigens TaxID=2069303 RepID=UPI003A8376C1